MADRLPGQIATLPDSLAGIGTAEEFVSGETLTIEVGLMGICAEERRSKARR